jgi:hypothetical protein
MLSEFVSGGDTDDPVNLWQRPRRRTRNVDVEDDLERILSTKAECPGEMRTENMRVRAETPITRRKLAVKAPCGVEEKEARVAMKLQTTELDPKDGPPLRLNELGTTGGTRKRRQEVRAS